MEPQKITQVRKVKIIYINDPGSDKPRPVYVTATSQPNTYQILQTPVIVTSASDGQLRYATTTTSSNMPITTTTISNYQQQASQQPQTFYSRPPISQPQTIYSRPTTVHQHPQQRQRFHQLQPQSTARRALIPQQRILNPTQQPPLIRFPKLPKLPAPFDFPEIKNFVSSKVLPILSADYIDGFFMDLNGSPQIIGKDFNVETLESPMLAPVQEVQQQQPKSVSDNLKYIPPSQLSKTTLKKANEQQRKAPMIMRRAVQNNRQRLNAAAPYTLLKENRQV
uniref:Uncharacterized protein n=1 Tax=Panagrolaimus sp. ES5 TaxID=591445 RepID=A0AC34GF24_9BILA